ncbi:taud/tfda taurine catabolism dioxygenase [Aspergillus lucknowensis]|uniref:Taud/tfda taurine catabolism dioxygenase n=1 Tax=Aspergillus lucknowensis TaxID=176173 RepID=A0ABR4LN61_9EURO
MAAQVQVPSHTAITPPVNGPRLLFEPTDYTPSVKLSQPYPPDTPFPLALSPTPPNQPISEKVSAIKALTQQGTINDLLQTHGAIYFKDLQLADADEFSVFAAAFGWTPHEDIGNPVRRTIHAYNVATANEGPNTQPVYPHNEFGLSPHYPAYVFFYCASPPETGGETPINNSIILHDRLKKKHPEFIEQLEKKGVKYQLFYPNTSRVQTSSPGTSVLQSYGKHVLETDSIEEARTKIENEIRRLPTATWAWENQSPENELGDLRVWQVLPAVRIHEGTGRPAFFNNIVSRFLNALNANTLQPPHINAERRFQPPAFYGDGSLIPEEYLHSAVDIIKETRSLVSWTKGDVVLLDNHAVQHAREPWTGPRKLLASLWDKPRRYDRRLE